LHSILKDAPRLLQVAEAAIDLAMTVAEVQVWSRQTGDRTVSIDGGEIGRLLMQALDAYRETGFDDPTEDEATLLTTLDDGVKTATQSQLAQAAIREKEEELSELLEDTKSVLNELVSRSALSNGGRTFHKALDDLAAELSTRPE
jgi:hypothetical protein